MIRTHNCGELRLKDSGIEVCLCGWIQTIRKFGSITFIDLRDRYGITQLIVEEDITLKNESVGREYVIKINGLIRERSNKNKQIPTGDIEVVVHTLEIINPSKQPPFLISDETDGSEELCMKYRYLDLRRNINQKNIMFRYELIKQIRSFLENEKFIEVETPFLINSTPEGARDFLVPSRVNKGQFYALPQSPQTFKQLLMVSGFDRYMQIVKCFRDEDLRADRQPEFTQLDCEMSFVEQKDVLDIFERLMKYLAKHLCNKEINEAFQQISWEEAMIKYGTDKPDTRFEMFINDITSISQGKGFNLFDKSEKILSICLKDSNKLMSRKDIDKLNEWIKSAQIGCGSVLYIRHNDDDPKSSFDKFFNKNELSQLLKASNSNVGDIVFIVTGTKGLAFKAMGEIRLKLAKDYNLISDEKMNFLWVVDFPLFEYDSNKDKWNACHHPFTSPKKEHEKFLDEQENIKYIKALSYDLVLNGTEIGGGSIRIHKNNIQQKIFDILGIPEQEQKEKFGFLLKAFEYGAPPHGGIALGLDRICAVLKGGNNIRNFIAFPKNNNGRDMMLNSPSTIDEEQLKELGITINGGEQD